MKSDTLPEWKIIKAYNRQYRYRREDDFIAIQEYEEGFGWSYLIAPDEQADVLDAILKEHGI